MSDHDVITRLRAGAPGYPAGGPDAGHTLAAARRALRRRRARQMLGSVAAIVAAVVGLTMAGPIELPGGHDVASSTTVDEPPVLPRQRLLDDVAGLEREVLPVTEEQRLTLYIDQKPACRVFTWSHGAFRDRVSTCSDPNDPESPFDAESDAAFARVSDAIARCAVNVYRIETGGPGTAFHLQDNSWKWNAYYSYVPGTPTDAPQEVRTDTHLGVRLQVHITGNWWYTVEPDD